MKLRQLLSDLFSFKNHDVELMTNQAKARSVVMQSASKRLNDTIDEMLERREQLTVRKAGDVKKSGY